MVAMDKEVHIKKIEKMLIDETTYYCQKKPTINNIKRNFNNILKK